MNTKKIQMQQGHYRGDTGVGATHPAGLPLTLVAPTPYSLRIRRGYSPDQHRLSKRFGADRSRIREASALYP